MDKEVFESNIVIIGHVAEDKACLYCSEKNKKY